ncbi:hypothetical protein BDW68DRAFT_188637 [Aspergillus falconensis]
MAEVFGVAAGALTLLATVFENIEKLKALRKSIKAIPGELQDLIEEIELVQHLLRNFTPDMYSFLDMPLTERRLSRFGTELETLISDVQRYQISTSGRRIGAMKLALKKDEIRERRRNLENIKGTLSLLQLTYSSVCFQELGPIMRARMTSRALEEEGPEDEDKQTSNQIIYRTRKTIPRTTKGKTWELRFRTPLIVIDKIWNLQLRRALSGWTFTIQTNNVIPRCAPIFTACLKRDVEEVQRLFSAGLATPHDCDETGLSLLMYATYTCQLELCQMLLNNGADPDYKRDHARKRGVLQIASSAAYGWIDHPESVPSIVDLFRMIIHASKDCYDPFEDLMRSEENDLFGFYGPPEALTIMQQYTFSNYSTLPLAVRFERAMDLHRSNATPAMLKIAMGGSIEPAAFRLRREDGKTLLHKIAQCMGWRYGLEQIDRAIKWRPLLSDAIAHSADPKTSWEFSGESLTTTFLRAVLVQKGIQPIWYNFNAILRQWATELKLAGVDLETYGANEKFFNKTRGTKPELHFYFVYKRASIFLEAVPARILELAYGPEPEDWQVWVTNPVDELVGEFWEMVERKEEVMPGTWVE